MEILLYIYRQWCYSPLEHIDAALSVTHGSHCSKCTIYHDEVHHSRKKENVKVNTQYVYLN